MKVKRQKYPVLLAIDSLVHTEGVTGSNRLSPNISSKCKVSKRRKIKVFSLRLLKAFEKSLLLGLLNGKPYSKATIQAYLFYLKKYRKSHKDIRLSEIRGFIYHIPPENYSKREKIYKSLLFYCKFLHCSENFLEELRKLKPVRSTPIVRRKLEYRSTTPLLGACKSYQEKILITLLLETGIRASEACDLLWSDIDLDTRSLTVRHGKGNKRRVIGIPSRLYVLLLEEKDKDQFLLRDRFNNQMHRSGIFQRVEKIGQSINIKLSPTCFGVRL